MNIENTYFGDNSQAYAWLLCNIAKLKKGSNIWAISLANINEWNESKEEKQFLKANMEAVKRGVRLERIFIVSKKDIENIKNNYAVKTQLENQNENLKIYILSEEKLLKENRNLYDEIGHGFFAYNNVVFADSMDESRGYVITDAKRVNKLKKIFLSLKMNFTNLI